MRNLFKQRVDNVAQQVGFCIQEAWREEDEGDYLAALVCIEEMLSSAFIQIREEKKKVAVAA